MARAAEDGVSQIYLLFALGQLAIRMQDEAEAREHFNEALGIAHRLRERWMAMNVLVALSRVSEEIDAGPAVEEMIGLLRQIGNRLMLVRWLRQLAYLRRMEGDVVGPGGRWTRPFRWSNRKARTRPRPWATSSLRDSSTRRRSIAFPLCGNSRLGFVSHTTSDRSGKRRLVSARSGASWLSLETTRGGNGAGGRGGVPRDRWHAARTPPGGSLSPDRRRSGSGPRRCRIRAPLGTGSTDVTGGCRGARDGGLSRGPERSSGRTRRAVLRSRVPGCAHPPPPPDTDCADIPFRRSQVLPAHPHNFDGDHNGIGCYIYRPTLAPWDSEAGSSPVRTTYGETRRESNEE